MRKVEFTEVQIEEIIKGIDEAVSVSTLLENDLGMQKDISSANAVCVIKDIMSNVRDMIAEIARGKSSRDNRND